MDSTGGCIDAFLVSVDIGAFDFRPFAKLLHRLKERYQFGTRLFAVCHKQLHRLIVGCILELCRSLQHGKPFGLIPKCFERCGTAVGANIDITGDHEYLFAQLHDLLLGFQSLFLHERCVHADAVIFHHAGVHRSGTFDFLTDETVTGNVVVKPFVEGVVQLQRPVAVRAGISAGIPFVGIQFIEKSALDYFLEGGKLHAVQIRHQLLQTAIAQISEFIVVFECQLRRHDRVIYRLLYNDAVLVQEHGFE